MFKHKTCNYTVFNAIRGMSNSDAREDYFKEKEATPPTPKESPTKTPDLANRFRKVYISSDEN